MAEANESGVPVQEQPTEGNVEEKSVASKCEQAEKETQYAIACFAGDIWLRDKATGKWTIETGTVAKRLLHVHRSNPNKSGLVDALKMYTAVDPNRTGEFIYFARNPGEKWRPQLPETFEVMTRTGIYNLKDKTFQPYNEKTITFGPLIDVVIDQNILEKLRRDDLTGAPPKVCEILAGLEYAINDWPTLKYFQQVVGQILRPHCGFNHFIHVYGESGSRKTTLLRTLLTAPCGINGCAEISEQLLSERYFSRVGLANKIANLSNDSALSRHFVSFIKEVTSGVLQVERKFCDTIRLPLTAKLFATMNAPQNYDDFSLGIENRLIAFKFRPREDNNRTAEGCLWANPSFYDEVDRQWLCSWLLVGLEQLFVNGREQAPTPSPLARAWKEELLNASSDIRAFVTEHVEFDKDSITPVSLFTDRAIEFGYCQAGDTARGHFASLVGKYLHTRHAVDKVQHRIEGKPVRHYKGIRLKQLLEK